jgi:hypothetical protein
VAVDRSDEVVNDLPPSSISPADIALLSKCGGWCGNLGPEVPFNLRF